MFTSVHLSPYQRQTTRLHMPLSLFPAQSRLSVPLLYFPERRCSIGRYQFSSPENLLGLTGIDPRVLQAAAKAFLKSSVAQKSLRIQAGCHSTRKGGTVKVTMQAVATLDSRRKPSMSSWRSL